MLQDGVDSPTANYIAIASNTSASDLCAAQEQMTRGGLFILSAGPCLIVAQVTARPHAHHARQTRCNPNPWLARPKTGADASRASILSWRR